MAKKLKLVVAGAASLVLLLGCYWAFSPSKISVYPNRTLIWKDFKQVPLINGSESINATCFSTTDFQINRIYDEGEYKRIDLKAKIALLEDRTQVSLHFLKRADGETKKQVLHHENGHFLIAQIIGRRIVQSVDNFLFDPEDYQSQLDSIVRSHYKEWSRLDQEYDHETTNPRNLEKQKEWDLFFRNELAKAGG